MATKKDAEVIETAADNAALELAKAEIAKMMAEAKAEIEKMKAEASGELSDEEKQKRADYEAYMNELVEVKLFKDNNKYKDDVYVGCNGENVVIKRGERVKIKRKFAEILEASDKQDYEAAKLIEAAGQMNKVADM